MLDIFWAFESAKIEKFWSKGIFSEILFQKWMQKSFSGYERKNKQLIQKYDYAENRFLRVRLTGVQTASVGVKVVRGCNRSNLSIESRKIVIVRSIR